MFLMMGFMKGLGLFLICLFSRVQFKNKFPHNDELNVFKFFLNNNTRRRIKHCTFKMDNLKGSE